MHHGSTVVRWDGSGSHSAISYLKLEGDNATLSWCKPQWSALSRNNNNLPGSKLRTNYIHGLFRVDNLLTKNCNGDDSESFQFSFSFADYAFSSQFETGGLTMKYGHGIQFDDNLEDGHLDLMLVKDVSLHTTTEGGNVDFKLIAKRHGLEDIEG